MHGKQQWITLGVFCVASLFGLSSEASLIGTTMGGSLHIGGALSNSFTDPPSFSPVMATVNDGSTPEFQDTMFFGVELDVDFSAESFCFTLTAPDEVVEFYHVSLLRMEFSDMYWLDDDGDKVKGEITGIVARPPFPTGLPTGHSTIINAMKDGFQLYVPSQRLAPGETLSYCFDLEVTHPIPEPASSSLLLMGIGLLGLRRHGLI